MSSMLYIDSTNMNHPERIAILETRMNNIEKGIDELKLEQKEQTKQIYKGLGAVAVIIVAVEIIAMFIKH